MFRPANDEVTQEVSVFVEDRQITVPVGTSAAVAAMIAVGPTTRTTPVSGAPRAPYCLMGVCFECLMEIDGLPNQQACQIPVREGMRIKKQHGTREAIRG